MPDATDARHALVAVQHPALRTFQTAAGALVNIQGAKSVDFWLGAAEMALETATEVDHLKGEAMARALGCLLRAFQAADLDASAQLKSQLLRLGADGHG